MQNRPRLRRSRSLSFSEKNLQCVYLSSQQPISTNKPREIKPTFSNNRCPPQYSKQTFLNIIIQQQNQTSLCANSPRSKEIVPRVLAADQLLEQIPLKFKKMLRLLIDKYEKERVELMLQVRQKEDRLRETEKLLKDIKQQMSESRVKDDIPMTKLSNSRSKDLAEIVDSYFRSYEKMVQETVQTPTTLTRNKHDQSFSDDFP